MITVQHILDAKGADVVTVAADVTVREAAQVLDAHDIGAVVVLTAVGSPCGVFSERDAAREMARVGAAALDMPVNDVMSEHVITTDTAATVDQVMGVMSRERVRHLPVLDQGALCGIVSIGDAVKHKIAQVEAEAAEMKRYIAG